MPLNLTEQRMANEVPQFFIIHFVPLLFLPLVAGVLLKQLNLLHLLLKT